MRILIIEDEPRILSALSDAVTAAGFAVDGAGDGNQGDFLARTNAYDAIILDLGLPRIDGITLLQSLREGGIETPVLILSARGTWHEKVVGIDSGADDYVAKPFRTEEVVARLRALIRRSAGRPSPVLRWKQLVVDPSAAAVTWKSEALRLTAHELRVLSYLMMNRDRVVPQSELVEHIYAQDYERDSNTIEVFVSRLRRKIDPALIETVRGLGYRLGRDS